MTTRGRSIDDQDLDSLLRTLIVEDASSPPRRMTEAALLTVATTPQRRAFPVVRPITTGGSRLLWIAAAVGLSVVAVFASLGGFPGVLPLPSATPLVTPALTPSVPPSVLRSDPPSPTATAPDVVTFSSAADGYQLQVPGSWRLAPRDFNDARSWVGTDDKVMISYGASIFDGGDVTICGPETPEWPTCQQDHYPFSVPYQPERDGVGPIDLSGYARDRCLGGCPIETSDTTLGGEAASQSTIEAGGYWSTYVSLFHNLRPVVLWWTEPLALPADQRFEAMRTSFRFVDAPPAASPTQFVDPTELIQFVDSEAGYQLRIPRYWAPTERSPAAGVHEFGSGRGFGTRTDAAFTISVGDTDGTVTICQDRYTICATVVVASKDELDSALRVIPASLTGSIPKGERTGALAIDGQPGGWKRPDYGLAPGGIATYGLGGAISGGNCLGCPGLLYHAWTIKRGRPIVISIDFWTIAFQEIDQAFLAEIIDSVHLLEP